MTNKVIIVGSAPSARGFIPPKDIPIIAVNGAIDWLQRADYFFTLDPSKVNMRRMLNKKKGVIYAAAVPLDVPLPKNVIRFERVSHRGKEPAKKNSPEWWCWRWSSVLGLQTDKTKISSGNSAYGAIGLAYHLGYRDILLVGVDASKEEKVGGGFSKNLTHLPLLLRSVANQVNLFSISSIDGINQIKLMDWLKQ